MNKIITPLRAEQSEDEPVYSFIYDKDGKYLFTVPHRYAAAIIAISEDAKRFREALREIANMPNESIWSDDRDDAAMSMVRIAERALKRP